MAQSNKEIAALIVDFLSSTVEKNAVSEDYADSLNVAIDCISEAFEFERDAVSEIVKNSFDNRKLDELLKSAATALPTQSEPVKVNIPAEDANTKAKAEDLKLQGNKAMASKDFETAIKKYSEAIEVLPSNAVYYANRAAAYSSLKKYEESVQDAQSAIEVNPSYSKGYSRLGFAKYALGKPEEALEAYKTVLDIEGDKATDVMKRDYETAKRKVEQSLNLEKSVPTQTDEQESSTDAGASAGAGAGTGGFPDMASLLGGGLGGLLNNPQVMSAAQKLMQNPGAMDEMMKNPAVRQMAENFSSGGGTPNLGDLMSNPAIKDMAKNLFGPN